jgi:beta-lactam-binding protein with PASTA domain
MVYSSYVFLKGRMVRAAVLYIFMVMENRSGQNRPGQVIGTGPKAGAPSNQGRFKKIQAVF